MIKVNVEWRHTCSSCGTQLVVDYLLDRQSDHPCPWCESRYERRNDDEQLRKLITDTVAKLEEEVNAGVHATG